MPKQGLLIRLIAYGLLGLVLLMAYAIRALGFRGLLLLGGGLGNLLRWLGFRGKIVRANLDITIGAALSPAEYQTLVKRIYRNVGITFLEIARNFSLSCARMAEELELSETDTATIQAILARGKGSVFISGHIGNWELLGMGMAAKKFPVSIVVKKMNNPLAQVLIERQRGKTGVEIIYSGNTLQKMKEALARGNAIGFMVDQNITGKKGIRANFLGVPAASIRGLANLVRETGTSVVPFCAVHLPNGKNRVEILPELSYLTAPELPENSPERLAREEWLNTQQYQHAIEQLVRRRPDQWLWIHRRWKTDRTPLNVATAHLENLT